MKMDMIKFVFQTKKRIETASSPLCALVFKMKFPRATPDMTSARDLRIIGGIW
jgi:hypothetical protein